MAQPQAQQRYKVIEKLAAGGMAEVFRAESAGLEGFKKQVAIKRVLPHLSEKKRFIQMFLDEARLSAHLSHSNCVQVFDIGVGDNAYFIVMEYVDGADLKAVGDTLRRAGRVFNVEDAVYVTSKMCEGLAYAHELLDHEGRPLSVVHRDMSPPNVLITKHGEVKVVDFGLAKAASQLERSEPGIIKGKFAYLSPEAALGKEVDHRTDIFAAGIILWEMLTGRRLFLGETDYQTVKLIQAAEVEPASAINTAVPRALDGILARALAREPSKRFQSARELGEALIEFQFKFGKPVSSWTIAPLVRQAMRERQRSRPQTSIIDKLIEEALFEFTSLQQGEAPSSGGKIATGRAPESSRSPSPILDAGRFDTVQDWASELSSPVGVLAEPRASQLTASVIEEGNLAALEEDENAVPSIAPAGLVAAGTAQAGQSATSPVVSVAPPPTPARVAGAAVLVVIVLAAVAYYSGLLSGFGLAPPH